MPESRVPQEDVVILHDLGEGVHSWDEQLLAQADRS
jgi:hypothetical protein